jgi:hypothetical protein
MKILLARVCNANQSTAEVFMHVVIRQVSIHVATTAKQSEMRPTKLEIAISTTIKSRHSEKKIHEKYDQNFNHKLFNTF